MSEQECNDYTISPTIEISSSEDYIIGTYISHGTYGLVVNGTKKSDGSEVAIKFFGYRSNEPIPDYIEQEINILAILNRCENVVQTLSVFMDTEAGLFPEGFRDSDNIPIYKRYFHSYKVIVMEKLNGGELLDTILYLGMQNKFSEQEASTIFKNFIIGVNEIHDNTRLINTDFKAQNIVFINPIQNDLSLKIIDFGLALPLHGEEYVIHGKRGTRGMFAPETLIYNDNNPGDYLYSKATDIWQAGCVLYFMLNACNPFTSDENSEKKIKLGIFEEIVLTVSDNAKDLINRIFKVNPSERITGPEILDHPFITQNVSTTPFGEEFFRKIRKSVFRKNFKQILVDRLVFSKKRKNELFEKASYKSKLLGVPADTHPPRAPCIEFVITDDHFRSLQRSFVQHALNEGVQSSSIEPIIKHQGIDFKTFVDFLDVADLRIPNPKQKEILFNVLDSDGSKYVDYFEFLFNLTPFREDCIENYVPHRSSIVSHARIYFEIFDIDNNGIISKDEFKCVLKKLLIDADETIFSDFTAEFNDEFDVIFQSIDTDGDNEISYDEFEEFITTINNSTLTLGDS